ncbi:MAG: hypothetical protein JXK04_02055 [Campylobacterales bacterium]|nr:hypothetical protein [Campylobacterales bacterium]
MNTKLLFTAIVSMGLFAGGCAEKQLVVNGMICPANINEERVRADFAECRVYDLEAASRASKAPLSIECQKCLESKGYKVEQ